eukprot:CAMPEP_0204250846 /NCGR_PEP_ID=MMETSP0361-20130328/100371_1 /ASSEMBLY_ACC=CAM_ASM_000343 /TAXON_ID=268821 /ORGANISM="Scrippsiella Hangoei, Strain SHTV-5" /LENGTH=503 /DNA_ID=CAMNT_0051224117 /DNA_START=173 /DNA_END=1682 /DNA_ORIENTATION=+
MHMASVTELQVMLMVGLVGLVVVLAIVAVVMHAALVQASRLGVRQNSCGTEGFSHFLPLYISQEHWRCDLCSRCLQAAWCRVPLHRVPNGDSADAALTNEAVWHVLPALMNSTAVAMMGGELHMSDVALRGYYNLHRLLLELASPELRVRAETEVQGFEGDAEKRLKRACPNLGHFLPRLLLVAEPTDAWRRIQPALLQETLDRTVLHAFREFPILGSIADEDEYARLRWQSAAKGLRMMLFSIRFLRHAVQWGSLVDVAAHYDRRFGQPSAAERDAFRAEVREILAIDSWAAFSRRWCAEVGTDEGREARRSLAHELGGAGLPLLVRRLRESEEHSSEKGYHPFTMGVTSALKSAVASHVERRHAVQWGSLVDVAAHYDRRFGQPSAAERDAFRAEVREILAIDSWAAFSRRWCAEVGTDEGREARRSLAHELGGAGLPLLVRRLRESEEHSSEKGYHPFTMGVTSALKSGRCLSRGTAARRAVGFLGGRRRALRQALRPAE